MALSKDEIVKGSQYSEERYIESLGGEVKIRKLSFSEEKEIERIQLRGVSYEDIDQNSLQEKLARVNRDEGGLENLDQDDLEEFIVENVAGMDVAIEDSVKNDRDANIKTVQYGLSVDEDWTADDVKQLGSDVVEEIANAVMELTQRGIESDEQKEINEGDGSKNE